MLSAQDRSYWMLDEYDTRKDGGQVAATVGESESGGFPRRLPRSLVAS